MVCINNNKNKKNINNIIEMIVSEICNQNNLDIQNMIIKNDKSTKSILQQMMIQLHMLNNSNTKIVNALKNIDKKVEIIMKSDTKMKYMALPIPKLSSAFINLLPTKSVEEVNCIESLLCDDNPDGIKNQEELVS